MNLENNKSAFGMIGLGTMGANLLQNIADNGYACSGYDINAEQVKSVNDLGRDNIRAYSDLKEFTDTLKSPKVVMLLVPAGPIVDSVVSELLAVLDQGDIIIDGGNSHFTNTERRFTELEKKGFHFVGMGVSGGEEGARKGPSMMPGGDLPAYEVMKPLLEKIAAHVNGDPTVAYMGERSAGHFVKMVHNGIEYALMQLISESYEYMKKGLQLSDSEIYEVFKDWNEGRLQSYLIEITRDIFTYKKKGTDYPFFNDIKDEAKAKGTGKWTSQAAMDLAVPVPIIDMAVSMRDLSKFKVLRTDISNTFPQKISANDSDKAEQIAALENSFYFAMVSAYSQGMHLLFEADKAYNYNLRLDTIAKIWRGGCIIRSAFLEDIYNAYQENQELPHLFLNKNIAKSLSESLPAIRKMITIATKEGIAVPAFGVALSYFDNIRTENMPANLIQAQRDYFGAHTYELIGKEGTFHTDWNNLEI